MTEHQDTKDNTDEPVEDVGTFTAPEPKVVDSTEITFFAEGDTEVKYDLKHIPMLNTGQPMEYVIGALLWQQQEIQRLKDTLSD